MARIRSIKPEFWSSEQVMDCSPMARLLFIGLWNFCDDGGNHPASAKTIKAEIFPGDDIQSSDVQRLLDELSSNGLITLYAALDKEFWHVTGWHHQKIDRPSFKHPAFDASLAVPPRRTLVEPHPPEGSGREGNGEERSGEEGRGEEHIHTQGDSSTLGGPDDEFAECHDVGQIAIAMRRHGVSVNPGDLRMIELARQGIPLASVHAACKEAKTKYPNQGVTHSLVIGFLSRWKADAERMNTGGARPPPQYPPSTRDASRAAAANSIGLGARHHDAEPDTFDAATGQRID